MITKIFVRIRPKLLDLAGYKTFMGRERQIRRRDSIKEKPSIIICDIMMPELDGCEYFIY